LQPLIVTELKGPWLSFSFGLRVLDKAKYSAFESTLNSAIVSYRLSCGFKSYLGPTMCIDKW